MTALCTLLFALAAHAEPVDATSGATPAGWNRRLYAGAQVGTLLPGGAQAQLGFSDGARPTWDLDLLVEPSRLLQSVSLGAAWRPFHNALAVGGRARWLQLHPPWSRGYQARYDNALALGLEAGGRWGVLAGARLQLSAGAGAFLTPLGADLPLLLELHAGAAWRLLER